VDWERRAQGPLVRREAVLGYLYTPEFLVTPLLMGQVCQLSQSRFEKPVRPW